MAKVSSVLQSTTPSRNTRKVMAEHGRRKSGRTEVSGLDLVHCCVCVCVCVCVLISYRKLKIRQCHIIISGFSKMSTDLAAVGLHSYMATSSWTHPFETGL